MSEEEFENYLQCFWCISQYDLEDAIKGQLCPNCKMGYLYLITKDNPVVEVKVKEDKNDTISRTPNSLFN